MQAIRLRPNPDRKLRPYSSSNPASISALSLDKDVPIPQLTGPNELLVKIEATTLVRDCLTWPEIDNGTHFTLGWDFAGTVIAVNDDGAHVPRFAVGDKIFGMTSAAKAGTWAQYAVVLEQWTCLMPKGLSWAQAAAVPMSALTAYQAFFEQGGLAFPDLENVEQLRSLRASKGSMRKGSILITGAAGVVGLYLVQLARLTGLYIVTATSSNKRNAAFLKSLGADDVVEYDELPGTETRFRLIIDTVGGNTLKICWSCIEKAGTIISIESASYDFAKDQKEMGLTEGLEEVKAIFFIVAPSGQHLQDLSMLLEAGVLESFHADTLPLSDAMAAYQKLSSEKAGRGKVVLLPLH